MSDRGPSFPGGLVFASQPSLTLGYYAVLMGSIGAKPHFMRLGIGVILLVVAICVAAWGSRKAWLPRKRARGMRIEFSDHKRDDVEKPKL